MIRSNWTTDETRCSPHAVRTQAKQVSSLGGARKVRVARCRKYQVPENGLRGWLQKEAQEIAFGKKLQRQQDTFYTLMGGTIQIG